MVTIPCSLILAFGACFTRSLNLCIYRTVWIVIFGRTHSSTFWFALSILEFLLDAEFGSFMDFIVILTQDRLKN